MLPGQRVIPLVTLVLLLGGAALLDSARAREGDRPPADQRPSGGAAPAQRGQDRHGEELYNASCLVCHGPGATGGIGPRLAGNSILADQQAFQKVLAEGRHMMPPLKDLLTGQQLTAIHAWLKTLQ